MDFSHCFSLYILAIGDRRRELELEYWVKPENTIHVQTCAVHACLDIQNGVVYTRFLRTLANVWRNRVCMKGVHMDWLFLQDLAGGSKRKEIWLTFFYSTKNSWLAGSLKKINNN